MAAGSALSGAVCLSSEWGWLSSELATHHRKTLTAMASAGGQILVNSRGFRGAPALSRTIEGVCSRVLTAPVPVLFG